MSTILVFAGTATPVPLPFHTESADCYPLTIVNFTDDEVSVKRGNRSFRQPPQMFGLEIISEADFMERQS